VLLIEVARSADDHVDDCEESLIERALARRFGLERNEVTNSSKRRKKVPSRRQTYFISLGS
jgi:hypothetical protein